MNQYQSESLTELAPALALAQTKIKHAVKDSENPHFQSRYADLAAVTDACRSALAEVGLSVVQTFVPMNGEPTSFAKIEYRKGNEYKVNVYLLGNLRTTLLHASGQFIASELPIMTDWSDPQRVGSVITYYRRYALAAIAGVATEDDDGNAGSSGSRQEPHREGSNGPVEFPSTDRMPKDGRGLYAWACKAGEATGDPTSWVKSINAMGKDLKFPEKMIEWSEQQLKVVWALIIKHLDSLDKPTDDRVDPTPTPQPQSDGSVPRSGRDLFSWLKDQDEKYDLGVLKHVNAFGKKYDHPARMIDWDTEQISKAFTEAQRKIRAVRASMEATEEAMSN